MNKHIRKVITSLLVALSLVTLAPISAHAEWKQSSNGLWWYSNGNSYYANGWYQIGQGNWYYFGTNGYMMTGWIQLGSQWYYCSPSTGSMLHDTYVGSYYLGSNGAWTTSSNASDKLHKNGAGLKAGNDSESAQEIASQNGYTQQSSSTESHKDYFDKADTHGSGSTSSDGTLSQSLQQGESRADYFKNADASNGLQAGNDPENAQKIGNQNK